MAPKSGIMYLDELISEHKQIYVRNKKKGIIALTVFEANGRSSRVIVPRTKHPVTLLEMATPYALQHSKSLREAVAGGALELIPPEQAEKELSDPQVRKELALAKRRIGYGSDEVAKLRQGNQASTATNAPSVLQGIQDEVIAMAVGDQKLPVGIDPNAPIGDAPPDDEDDSAGDDSDPVRLGIDSRVAAIVQMVTDGEKPAKEAKLELNNMLEDISNDDLDYIVTNSKGVLREWAQQVLAMRRGQNVPVEALDADG